MSQWIHIVYVAVIFVAIAWQGNTGNPDNNLFHSIWPTTTTSRTSAADAAAAALEQTRMLEQMTAQMTALQKLVMLTSSAHDNQDPETLAKLQAYLDTVTETAQLQQQQEQQRYQSNKQGAGNGETNRVAEDEEDEEDSWSERIIGLGCAISFFLAFAATVYYLFADEIRYIRAKRASTNVELGKLLSYRLDYWFSSSPSSKVVALLLMTWMLIGLGGILLFVAKLGQDRFSHTLFQSWVFVADSAAHSEEEGLLNLVVSLAMTIAGMLVFGFLIGIVTDVISEKVDELKRGKSIVVESDHILLLNWSEKALNVIHELAVANESEGGALIVILSDQEKEDVEQIIESAMIDLRGTSIVVRSGNPALLVDLKKVSAEQAKCVVVLADGADGMGPDESDAKQLRIVLALLGMARARQEELKSKGIKVNAENEPHYVVELCDVDNEDLFIYLGGEKVETVIAHDVVGRLMIQCSRNQKLSQVMDSLLGFDGDEFYSAEWPELVGLTFDQACYWFPDAVCVGIRRPVEGSLLPDIILNPHSDELIREGDHVLVIAEDNDTYRPVQPTEDELKERRDVSYFAPPPETPDEPERLLFCGWRRDIDDMVVELDGYVAKGTVLVMLSEVPVEQRFNNADEGGLDVDTLENLELQHVVGNRVSRRHLERLELEKFDSVLILADEHLEGDVQKMDSFSLATLLLVNDICKRRRVQGEAEEILRLEEKMQADLNLRKWRRLEEQSGGRIVAPAGSSDMDGKQLELVEATMGVENKSQQDDGDPLHSPYGRFKFRTQRSGRHIQRSASHADEEDVVSAPSLAHRRAASEGPGGRNATSSLYERRGDQPYSFVHSAITPSPSISKKKKKKKKKEKREVNKTFPSFYPAPTSRSRGLTSSRYSDDSSSSSASPSSDSEQDKRAPSSLSVEVPPTSASISPALTGASSRSSRSTALERVRALKSAKSHLLVRDETRKPVVISEILDHRTKALIESAGVSDYVASNELVSKAIAMVAENKEMNIILAELLTSRGNETYVRKLSRYAAPGDAFSFWHLFTHGRRSGEIVIGYIDFVDNERIVINPSDKTTQRIWHKNDKIIAIADD